MLICPAQIMQIDEGDGRFPEAATFFEILLDSLATVIWQLIPPDDPTPYRGQYHPNCVQAARRMLSTIEKFGTMLISTSLRGWTYFINMYVAHPPCSSPTLK